MPILRRCLSCFVLFVVATGLAASAPGLGFQPVSPDELKMTSEPKAPGAPAVILFRQVDRDDRGLTAHEDVYFRIKILTEDGLPPSTPPHSSRIPIPGKGDGNIVGIHARTIKPDGTTVDFGGKAFDKEIVKTRGVKYLAKTFTLPDVQVGSVIEYFYTTAFNEYSLFESHWVLNDQLYTKSAKFSLRPYDSAYGEFNMRWTWHNLPPGTSKPEEAPNKVINLEVKDVPAFQPEDYMPPENEMKARVDFIYSEDTFEKDAAVY